MAESMIGWVTGLIVLAVAVAIVVSHFRRAHHRERWMHRPTEHRGWDRMRHRH
jgi:hypothetical protein